jgi:hypothetical protein
MSKQFEPIEYQPGDRVTLSNTRVGECTIACLYLTGSKNKKTEYYAEVFSNLDGTYYKVPVNQLQVAQG